LVLVSFSATGVEREVGKVEVEDESLAIDDVLRGVALLPCEMDWFGVVPRLVAATGLLIIYTRCLDEGVYKMRSM
jgi:hypothetical protein